MCMRTWIANTDVRFRYGWEWCINCFAMVCNLSQIAERTINWTESIENVRILFKNAITYSCRIACSAKMCSKKMILNSLFWFWVVSVGARYCALIVAKAARTRINYKKKRIFSKLFYSFKTLRLCLRLAGSSAICVSTGFLLKIYRIESMFVAFLISIDIEILLFQKP